MVKRIVYTLIFVTNARRTEVLLGKKCRGLGVGRWNGFGGKVERHDRNLLAAADRELFEECQLRAADHLRHVGIVTYFDNEREDVVHLFVAHSYEGTPAPSEEMSPVQWFPVSALPVDQMWPDTPLWLDDVLHERYFRMRFLYEETKRVHSYQQRFFKNQREFQISLHREDNATNDDDYSFNNNESPKVV